MKKCLLFKDHLIVYLCESHFRNNRQHNFLPLRRVRILLVLIEPGLERIGALARCILAPDTVGHVVVCAVSIGWKCQKMSKHVFYSRVLRAKG